MGEGMKTFASWYGADGEKLNQNVSMLASEVCPECKGKCGLQKELNPVLGRIEIHEYCLRCHGDGFLSNPVKFIPEGLTCASNAYPLGTWLKITHIRNDGAYADASFQIIVMVTDRMAGWLNSENGKYKYVCTECHKKHIEQPFSSSLMQNRCSDCVSGGSLIKTRDIDLSRGSFKKLAPLDVGIINVDVEIL